MWVRSQRRRQHAEYKDEDGDIGMIAHMAIARCRTYPLGELIPFVILPPIHSVLTFPAIVGQTRVLQTGRSSLASA